MSELALKPCPFCGGKAVFKKISDEIKGDNVGFYFRIECIKCKVSLPKRYSCVVTLNEFGEIHTNNDYRKEAAETWNRRADDAIP